MANIFLTGATGYIGGSVLHVLIETHSEFAITALVRDANKGAHVTKAYPNIKIVQGTLDDADILEYEASQADIVVPHWIQISGASVLSAPEIAAKTFGGHSEKVYDDWDGIEEIRSLLKKYPSRAVDNYVLNVAKTTPSIKTALVFPPIIYGQGQGPVSQRSIQIPELVRVTLQRGRGVQVGKGLSRWGNVHVQDLSNLFLRLVERAAFRKEDKEVWGLDGLYLTGVGEMSFDDISRTIAQAAFEQRFVPQKGVDEVGAEEANGLSSHGAVLWGTNARSHARRGKELLGWDPSEESLDRNILRTLDDEAQRIGVSKLEDKPPKGEL